MIQNIHGNIITDLELFQNLDSEIFIPLTRFIARDIDRKTHVPDVEKVVIIPSEDSVSKCYWMPSPKGGNGRFHVIKMSVDDTDISMKTSQWIQEFAHEYMHHAIDRKEKFSAPRPLVWFDEALCQVSSICIADDIHHDLKFNRNTELHWLKGDKVSLLRIIVFPAQIVQDHLFANLVAKSIRNGEGIQKFLPFPEEGFDLALCSIAIALCTRNLFQENPNLWKIVPHVNEVPFDADVHSLFLHLKKTADSSYKDSLDKLINILLP